MLARSLIGTTQPRRYYAHRAKNTAKAKEIRDRKSAEKKAAKARLDTAMARNARMRETVTRLETILEQLKARGGFAQ